MHLIRNMRLKYCNTFVIKIGLGCADVFTSVDVVFFSEFLNTAEEYIPLQLGSAVAVWKMLPKPPLRLVFVKRCLTFLQWVY